MVGDVLGEDLCCTHVLHPAMTSVLHYTTLVTLHDKNIIYVCIYVHSMF